MLNRLITAGIVLAIAYFLLTKAGPLIQKQFGAPPTPTAASGGGEDVRCVDLAAAANDSLGQAARNYGQPPVDVEAWSNAVWQLESEIQAAASACYCSAAACRKASEAIDEMRALLSNLDGMVRGTSPGFANPAHQQERVFQLLKQARTSVER